MKPDKGQIVEASKNGDFLVVCNSIVWTGRDELKSMLIDLHNEGALDVVDEFARLQNNDRSSIDFFGLRFLFQEILPHLRARVATVCACVKVLVERAGTDGAAGWTWEAYQNFLEQDECKVEEGLQIALKGEAPAESLLPVLLAGLKVNFEVYLERGITLVLDKSLPDSLRANALLIFSQTRYFHKDPLLAERILSMLEMLSTGQESEQILEHIPCAVVSCLVLGPDLEDRVQKLITSIAQSHLPSVLYGISRAGSLFVGEISVSMIKCLLENLVCTRSEHRGVITNIDRVLTALLTTSCGDVAVEFLFDYIAGHEKEERLSDFPSGLRALAGNPDGAMDVFVTRCFLSDDRSHLYAMDHLVRQLHGHLSFKVRMDGTQLFEPKNEVAWFLARKAIGYFYTIPEACVSYVVSTLDAMGDAERKDVLQVFINPFALSYSDCIEKFLSANNEQLSSVARQFLDTSLKEISQFFEDIRQAGVFKELRPSEKQTEAHRRRWGAMVEKSFREAQEKSFISAICTNITLLHGRGWVRYFPDKDGVMQRRVSHLERMNTSVNIPVLWNVDPFGLDYVLRTCRAERLMR